MVTPSVFCEFGSDAVLEAAGPVDAEAGAVPSSMNSTLRGPPRSMASSIFTKVPFSVFRLLMQSG